MRSLPLTVLAAVLAMGTQVHAQDVAPKLESSSFSSFERGDGILSLTLGLSHVLGYYNPNTQAFEKGNALPGFAFSLSYTGFLNEDWAIAGDLAGGYVSTVNDDRLFTAPLALRLVRAFPFGAFVIAPSVGTGVAISALGAYKHVDLLIKAGSSFLWKASSDMSYGLNVYTNIIPQIMQIPANTRVGAFLEATLSVAYHL